MILATTARLVLRDLEARDAPHILRLNSDPEVLKYVHDVPFADLDAAARWIEEVPRKLPHGFGRWTIEKKDGTWLGRCSLRRSAEGETLMGYRLLREHWGQGFATETARCLLEIATTRFEVPCVLIHVARENVASANVAQKCGARLWSTGPAIKLEDALIYRFERP